MDELDAMPCECGHRLYDHDVIDSYCSRCACTDFVEADEEH